MVIKATKPERCVRPMECASIRYTCEQVEDSIQRLHETMECFKRWVATSEADLQHYRRANYLGSAKDELVKQSEKSVERYKDLIAQGERDISRLLEVLQEARTLEKHILDFWKEKDVDKGGTQNGS